MANDMINEYMCEIKKKRTIALCPTKLSWHVQNKTKGKINDMIKMNFSYLNKGELKYVHAKENA